MASNGSLLTREKYMFIATEMASFSFERTPQDGIKVVTRGHRRVRVQPVEEPKMYFGEISADVYLQDCGPGDNLVFRVNYDSKRGVNFTCSSDNGEVSYLMKYARAAKLASTIAEGWIHGSFVSTFNNLSSYCSNHENSDDTKRFYTEVECDVWRENERAEKEAETNQILSEFWGTVDPENVLKPLVEKTLDRADSVKSITRKSNVRDVTILRRMVNAPWLTSRSISLAVKRMGIEWEVSGDYPLYVSRGELVGITEEEYAKKIQVLACHAMQSVLSHDETKAGDSLRDSVFTLLLDALDPIY